MEFMKFFYRHKKATAKDNVLDGVIQSINKLVFPRGINNLKKKPNYYKLYWMEDILLRM